MNTLTGRVKDMLDSELHRAADLQEKSQKDPILPCFNRGYVLSWLSSYYATSVEREQKNVILIKIHHLADINTILGREKTDVLLKDLLAIISGNSRDTLIGRLNGSDFLAIMPFLEDGEEAFPALYQQLDDKLQSVVASGSAKISCVATELEAANSKEECLAQLDTLLSDLAVTSISGCKKQKSVLLDVHGSNYWRKSLLPLLEQETSMPRTFPVVLLDASLSHHKLFLQLDVDGQLMPASQVIGWIKRFGWMHKVDLLMCKTALSYTGRGEVVAITLSEMIFHDEAFFYQLLELHLKIFLL
jgi:GGDEF domain-containing protein